MKKKCTEKQTQNMIRHAATSTNERELRIRSLLEAINHNASPSFQASGIQMDTKFTEVPARQLDAPLIEYKDRKIVKPQNGAWRMDGDRVRNEHVKFLKIDSPDIKWSILNTDSRTQFPSLKSFADMVCTLNWRFVRFPL